MKSLLAVALFCSALFLAQTAFAAECGNPGLVARQYLAAVMQDDAKARKGLVVSLLGAAQCLEPRDRRDSRSELKGKYAVALRVLAALRRVDIHLTTAEDLQANVAKWARRAPEAADVKLAGAP